MARQSLLDLGLQRAVFGVTCRVASKIDTVASTVAAVTELREPLEYKPRGHGRLTVERARESCVGIRRRAAARVIRDTQRSVVLCDRGQIELVQVDSGIAKRQE